MSEGKRKLFDLTFTQSVLGIVVLLGTIAGGANSFIVLPTKVEALQKGQTQIWERIGKDQDKSGIDHEILVRIQEQMSQMQREQAEIKSDVKAIRRSQ